MSDQTIKQIMLQPESYFECPSDVLKTDYPPATKKAMSLFTL